MKLKKNIKASILRIGKFKRKTRVVDILETVVICLIVFFIGFFILHFYTSLDYYEVHYRSMQPTLNNNASGIDDVVFISKRDKINLGDIIVIDQGEGKADLIKRLIARGGDKVGYVPYVKDNTLAYRLARIPSGLETFYEIDEPYLKADEDNKTSFEHFNDMIARNNFETELIDGNIFLVLQEDEMFYLGDNRANSDDCSSHGPAKAEMIVGKVVYIIKEQKFFFIQIFQQLFGIKQS